jgi:hypothetical protein
VRNETFVCFWMTFEDKLSANLTFTCSRLAAEMDDGIAKDSDSQNGLKQAVANTISEKRIFGVVDAIDEQNW